MPRFWKILKYVLISRIRRQKCYQDPHNPQYIQFGGIIGLSDHLNDNKLHRLSHKWWPGYKDSKKVSLARIMWQKDHQDTQNPQNI